MIAALGGRPRRWRTAAPRVLLATGCAALLAGCGGGGAGTPEATVEQFYRALGERDPAAACALVAEQGRPLQADELTVCRSGFEVAVGQVATAEELAALRATRVTGARVEGDRATVGADQITGVPAAYAQEVRLVRVEGRWYIEPG